MRKGDSMRGVGPRFSVTTALRVCGMILYANVQVQGYEFGMACLLKWHDRSVICFNDLYLAM